MSEMWEVVSDAGSPLLAELPVQNRYVGDREYYVWNVCPIDNSLNYSCFHLPGVTDATPQSHGPTG